MAELAGAGASFPASARVPGAAGEGFDLGAWYAALIAEKVESEDSVLPVPTHLVVRAADDFQAIVPWSQLEQAFFQYAADGKPLTNGGPLRLYVPDGTSACLNVKNVVYVRFAAEPLLGEDASYGFVRQITPERLSRGYRDGKFRRG